MKRRGGETPRQDIRCLLPPDQIFPAARCEGVDTRTAARMGGGVKVIFRGSIQNTCVPNYHLYALVSHTEL